MQCAQKEAAARWPYLPCSVSAFFFLDAALELVLFGAKRVGSRNVKRRQVSGNCKKNKSPHVFLEEMASDEFVAFTIFDLPPLKFSRDSPFLPTQQCNENIDQIHRDMCAFSQLTYVQMQCRVGGAYANNHVTGTNAAVQCGTSCKATQI